MGKFIYDEVKFIHTSDITGYIENPNGAFQCINVDHCSVDWIRYKPSPNELIPDVIRCPKCSSWMMNDGLAIEWSRSIQDIQRASAGIPDTYHLAAKGLEIFKRFYTATVLVENINEWEPPVIPALDVIIDIAPKIFDENAVNAILKYVSSMNLRTYSLDVVKEKTSMLALFKNAYYSLPLHTVIKQTDLKAQFKESFPYISDPTWIFYIWSNFGLVKRTKEKNRVYLERIKD